MTERKVFQDLVYNKLPHKAYCDAANIFLSRGYLKSNDFDALQITKAGVEFLQGGKKKR